MASLAKRDTFREKKMGDCNPSSVHTVANEPEIYARAMVTKVLNIDKPEVYVGTIKEFEVHAETHLDTMVAKIFD